MVRGVVSGEAGCGSPVHHHVWDDDEGQDPDEHQDDSDGDDGHDDGVITAIGAKQSPQPPVHSARRPPHVHHCPGLLHVHRALVSAGRVLALGLFCGHRLQFGGARRRPLLVRLQHELSFAAFETYGQDALHLRGKLLNYVLVSAEAR